MGFLRSGVKTKYRIKNGIVTIEKALISQIIGYQSDINNMIKCAAERYKGRKKMKLITGKSAPFAIKIVTNKLTSVRYKYILNQYIYTAIKAKLAAIFLITFMVGTVSAEDSILKISNREILAENYEYAILSSTAYDTTYQDVFIDGSKYEVDRIFNDFEGDLSTYNIFKNWLTTSGLNATLYKNDDTNEVVISFRGTELQPSDIIEDIKLPFGNSQQELALGWVKQMLEEYPGYNFSLTGHSLGGGLAQYVSYYTGLDAVTYNAAHVPATIRGESRDNIVSIYNNVDILGTSLQAENNQIGKKYIINIPLSSDAACITPFGCHRMKYLLEATYIAVDELGGRSIDTSSSQYEYTPPTVELSSAPEEDPIVSHFAVNPNLGLTDDIIADLVEEADPDEPVTPEPVLVGVFSGVNGHPNSNLAIQGTLSNITETGTGNASFGITGGCVSGCTVSGTTPAAEASSYSHLSWGRLSQTVLMDEGSPTITNMRWLYGDATRSEYLNTRTGTASYAGQIYGDYTNLGEVDALTRYNSITGGIGLSFNFSDDMLSGQAYFSLDGIPQEGFDVVGRIVLVEGQQNLQAELTTQDLRSGISKNYGGFLGTFYGSDASEVGGAIWLSGQDSVRGIFAAQEGATFVMPDIDYEIDDVASTEGVSYRITRNKARSGARLGVFHTDAEVSDTNNTIAVNGTPALNITETFSSSAFKYNTWGKWESISTGSSDSGFWVGIDRTPASVVQNRTGNATYRGNIIGDFVSDSGVRDDARGLINITADFSNQSVNGQMQFGHDCGSGKGPSGCNVTSGLASFNEAINDYEGAGFGNHTNPQTSGSGVVGIFGGPNAEEIGGNAWLEDNNGMYNGAFIAK